jgi:hypothetical protein
LSGDLTAGNSPAIPWTPHRLHELPRVEAHPQHRLPLPGSPRIVGSIGDLIILHHGLQMSKLVPSLLLSFGSASSTCHKTREARLVRFLDRVDLPSAGQVAGHIPTPAQSLFSVLFFFIFQIYLFYIIQTITPNKMCYILKLIRKI